MEQPLISLILPVYGVEDYLEECIQSVVGQTYQNIEIILVDDGSKDRCPQIIDEWAKKDPRIRPIHKENGGQSSARNLGMELAKGEYITFIDSDDWVAPEYCQILYDTIVACKGQIAVGSYSRVLPKKIQPASFFLPSEQQCIACPPQKAVQYFLEQANAVWGKMYRTDILHDIRFPEGRLAEEYGFQLQALQKANTVGFCNAHLYFYRIRGNSDAHSIKSKYLLDNIFALDEAYHTCAEHFPEEVQFCKQRLCALLYEFLAAKTYGQETAQRNPGILVHALQTAGGQHFLTKQMETPLAIIFYTYNQFYPYLTKEEKQKLQRDYRNCFSFRDARQYGRTYWIKYLPSYISLELMRRINKWRSA